MVVNLLSCLSIIIVILSVFIIGYRIFYINGFNLKKIYISTNNNSYYPEKKECLKIFNSVLLFRIFIIIVSIIVYYIFINNDGVFSIKSAIDNWIKWDALHYLRIANGYSSYIENGMYPTLVFFPLYPFFIAVFKLLFNEVVAGLIVSNLFSSLACVYIYKLVSMDYAKKTALITILIINIFPFAFFFSSIMSESTFLLFSAMTLYYIRKHKWIIAGIFGFLCALSRSLGVFIIIPAIVELVEEYKLIKNINNIKYIIKIIKKMLPLLLIPLGFGIYLYCNYHVTGDWFYFLKMQREIWYQVFTPFYKIFIVSYDTINSFDTNFILCISIRQLFVIVLSYLVLLFNVKNNRTMYTIWLLVNIIVNTSMSWPLSVCRYFTCTIPLFIFIANYLKKHRYLFVGYIIVSIIFYAIFFVAFLKGYIY